MDIEEIRAAAEARRRAAERAKGGVSTNSAAVDEFQGKIGALVDGAHNGITFGFGDNLAGVKGAVFGQKLEDDGTLSQDYSGTMSERYNRERDARREQIEQSRTENPGQYFAGNVLGGAVPAVAGGLATLGGSLPMQMVKGALLGGAEGGAHGAGNADGQNILAETGRGAGVGAVAGALAPGLVAATAALKNTLKDPATGVLDALLNRANQGKANRAIASTLQSSGKSPDEVAQAVMEAAQAGQPEFRMMDALGKPGRRRVNGIVRGTDDEASTEIANFLEQRQNSQGERVAAFVEDAFDLQGTTAKQARATVKQGRDDAADLDFGSIRSNNEPVDIRDTLALIDSKVAPFQTADIDSPARSALENLRKQLAGGDDPSFELSNFDKVFAIRKSLRDDISAAYRNGRNELAKDLQAVKSAMDDALQASNPSYRRAMDDFAASSRVMDAFDKGQEMSRPGARQADTTQAFNAMEGDQQAAARAGYGDRLLAPLEANTADTANKAKPLQSMKRNAEAQAMAIDPDLYAQRLAREKEMWETQNTALRGSQTANNQQDIGAVSEVAKGFGGALQSAGNFQFGDAIAQTGRAIAPYATGQTEATRKLIAQALMSRDPKAALAPALRQDMQSRTMRSILEALARTTGREGYISNF